MSISVTGLGSGLDYASWIEQLVAIKQAEIDKVSDKITSIGTQKSVLSGLENSYSTFLNSVQAFTKSLSFNNVFNQKTASSSNEAVSAKVNAYAGIQTVNVSVSDLATATKAKSADVVASKIDETTILSSIADGSIKEGTFSIFVDGTKHSVEVATSDTMESFLDKISTATGLAATVDSATGKVSIGEGSTSNIVIGSNADTSNILNVLALSKNEDGTYISNKSIFDTNTSEKLIDTSFAQGKVTEGTFKIGSAEFTVDGTTTLKSLISKINSSQDAGVSAYWDANAGKIVLESKTEGAININVESGSSNFTEMLGLTTGGSIAEGSQTLGTNAKLTINGTEIISSSNTITSDISGITGLTLTLNSKTSSDAKISVSTDIEPAVKAVKEFVENLNTVISQTDTVTAKDGYLYGESILTSLRNKIRTMATASVDGTEGYKSLANIGITTGAVGASVSANTSKLIIDENALKDALSTNPEAVMKLLIGDKTTETQGVLNKIETVIDSSIDPVDGYFANREYSFGKQIGNLEDKAESMTNRMKAYKSQLEAKFAAMDTLISALQKQASIFDSYMGNLNKSKDD